MLTQLIQALKMITLFGEVKEVCQILTVLTETTTN